MIQLSDIIKNDLTASVIDTQYLIKISNNIYIASRKQMFGVGDSAQYYEDRDLKISRIGEKIDLKTNKIQLSSVTITLSNFPVNAGVWNGGDRISNNSSLKIGASIDIYLKTQSCVTLTDCMQIASLKITRYTHDEKVVKISADDVSLDSFYKQIPRPSHVLEKDVNTFENYNLKPVPILYGHLESAPAVVYVKDMNTEPYNINNHIELLFDGSAINEEIDIDGAKQMNIYASVTSGNKLTTNLVNNDVVQIKIGDTLCSVSCFPYVTTTRSIKDKWGYGQYRSTYRAKIILRTNGGTNPTLLTNGALWVHTNSTPSGCSAYKMTALFEEDTGEAQSVYSVWKEEGSSLGGGQAGAFFNNLNTEADTGLYGISFDSIGAGDSGRILRQAFGVQVIEFKPVPSVNIYSEVDIYGARTEFPTDVNFTGNMQMNISADAPSRNYRGVIWACPSGIKLDPSGQGEFIGFATESNYQEVDDHIIRENVGYPSALGSTFLNQMLVDDRRYPYWMQKYMSEGAVFRFEVGGDEGQSTATNYISYLTHPILHEHLTAEPPLEGSWWSEQAIKPFESNFYSSVDIEHSNEWGDADQVAEWKPIESNELALYYTQYPYHNSAGVVIDGVTETDSWLWENSARGNYIGKAIWDSVVVGWGEINYRRMWAEADVFNKDFFVNARGRLGKLESSVTKVSGYFVQWNEGQDYTAPSVVTDNINLHGHLNDHINKFYTLLTDPKYARISVNDIACELMFHNLINGKHRFIYEIDIEDITATLDVQDLASNTDVVINTNPFIGHEESGGWVNDFQVEHNTGVVLEFRGKIYSEGTEVGTQNYTSARKIFGGELVYAYKTYNENNEISGIHIVDPDQLPPFSIVGMYLFMFNNANKYADNDPEDVDASWGYTQVLWEIAEEEDAQTLVRNPAEIIKHLAEVELGIATIDVGDKYLDAFLYNKNINLDFSINEVQSSKDVIEKVCEQSRSFFRYRASDGQGIFETIKNSYAEIDVDETIDVSRMIKYKFSKTKIEDLCFGGVSVKYKYDYAQTQLSAVTAIKRLTPANTNWYKQLYDIDDAINYEKELEAPYIQDESSALQYRNFYFELNKQQHLLCKFSLSIRDGLHIEVGDVLKFSDNPNKLLSFGKSIIVSRQSIDQQVYPYFLVTGISKTEKEVEIEVYQLHQLNLLTSYPTLIGDATLDGVVNMDDIEYLNAHLLDNENNYVNFPISEQQLVNCDMNGNGYIDIFDILQIEALPYFVEDEEEEEDVEIDGGVGDINLDGTTNTQADLALLWKHIMYLNQDSVYVGLPSDELTGTALANADVNADGVVDFKDYIAMCILAGTEYSHGADWVYGDIDGDGSVTMHDYNILIDVVVNGLELPSLIVEGNPDDSEWNTSGEVEGYFIRKRADYNFDGEFHPEYPHVGLPNIDEQDVIDMGTDYGWEIPEGLFTVIQGDVNGDGVVDFHDWGAFITGFFDPDTLTAQQFANTDITEPFGQITQSDWRAVLEGANPDGIDYVGNWNYCYYNTETNPTPIGWGVYNYFESLTFPPMTPLSPAQMTDFKVWFDTTYQHDLNIQDFLNMFQDGDDLAAVLFVWDLQSSAMFDKLMDIHGDPNAWNSEWLEIANTGNSLSLDEYPVHTFGKITGSQIKFTFHDDHLATNPAEHIWGFLWTNLTWEGFSDAANSSTTPPQEFYNAEKSYINIVVEHEDLTSIIDFDGGWTHTWASDSSVNNTYKGMFEFIVEQLHGKALKISTNGIDTEGNAVKLQVLSSEAIYMEDGSETDVDVSNFFNVTTNQALLSGLTVKINSNIVL